VCTIFKTEAILGLLFLQSIHVYFPDMYIENKNKVKIAENYAKSIVKLGP